MNARTPVLVVIRPRRRLCPVAVALLIAVFTGAAMWAAIGAAIAVALH